jgi:hypothetical protein
MLKDFLSFARLDAADATRLVEAVTREEAYTSIREILAKKPISRVDTVC